jgi:1-acyl-sn-glycerol-3-phosphate acyltransferase
MALCGVRLQVTGREKLRSGERYLFFSNHQSALDIPVFYAALDRPLCFIAKKELFLIPFFGWGISVMGHVRIDRGSARKARLSLTRAVARLKRLHFSLILFPEGTRSVDGRLREFKQGSFALALEAGVWVVPVAIRKANERLRKKSLIVNCGPVLLDIGDPIDPAGMNKGQLSALVRDKIAEIVEPKLCVGR